MSTTNASNIVETPLDRLLAEISPSSSSYRGTIGMESTSGTTGFAMHAARTLADPQQALGLLHELRSRLEAADDLYPGIGEALDRGTLIVVDDTIRDLQAHVEFRVQQAESAERIARDRIEGARTLYDQLVDAQRQAARLSGLDFRSVALAAQVFELEATIRRISKNGNRVIAGCRTRAAQTTSTSDEEPF